uniref:peptidylprolyl isomerase n=1 Tax=Tetradesmus obliquus TaxID=3088 RepID=A0A383VMA4_TETOB|eukprot:jgi/Sobl393_1/9065/SZX66655.1
MVDRRTLLAGTAAVLLATSAEVPAAVAATRVTSGDWSSPGLAAPEDENLPKFFKTASGVKVQELAPGSGQEAKAGDSVLIDYVLRRNNGYFIYSTIEGVSFQPRDVPIGPIRLQLGSGSEVIEGLQDAIVGMRQGGKRRVLIPPELGYVSSVLQPQPPTFATKRQLANHSSESLLFEIELLRVLPA